MSARSKAFTIAEMLVAIAMSMVLMLALFELYESTQKIFFNTNSISGAEENAYNAYAVMQKFFDRWGVGVPSNTNSTGGYPPPAPNYVSISSGSPCDSLTFYADLYGLGVVQSVSSGTANMISCRLSTTDNSGNPQCYYLLSGTNFYYSNSSNTSPDLFTIPSIDPDNANCISSTNSNASISNATIYDVTTNASYTLSPGNILYAVPYQVTFFCQSNTNDNNNLWLYVQTINEAAQSSTSCGSPSPNIQPVAPVSSVHFNAYPSGCMSTNSCNMIQATIGVNSQEKNASGGTSSITFSFYFYK